jgi:hypothetical protein
MKSIICDVVRVGTEKDFRDGRPCWAGVILEWNGERVARTISRLNYQHPHEALEEARKMKSSIEK